jgi:hypothetical protein
MLAIEFPPGVFVAAHARQSQIEIGDLQLADKTL